MALTIHQLSIAEKISVAVSACVVATAAFFIGMKLKIAPSYSDFIVGNITWQAETKLQDLVAPPLFILVLFFGYLLFASLLARQSWVFGAASSTQLSNQLIWWSIPSLTAICGLILGAAIDKNLVFLSAACICCVVCIAACNTSEKIHVNPEVAGLYVFATSLLALIPIQIALIIGRLPFSLVGSITLDNFAGLAYGVVGFCLIAAVLCAVRYPAKVLKELPKLILLGQIGLPSLYLTLYPARLVQPDGKIIHYETTLGLKFLVASMIAGGLFDVVRRYKKYLTSTDRSLTLLFSPTALFAVLVAFKMGNTFSPQISPDDYHFGEMLLGWWSYLHGAIPYVSYFPAHGLVPDDLSAFISFIFYDGTAGSFAEAQRLGFALMAFFTFISVYRLCGSAGLAFISTFFISGYLTWLFLAPFVCLWFSQTLRANPARWLSIWLLTIPVVILGVPGQGLVLVAAFGVIAVQMTWAFWRSTEKRAWRDIGICLTLLIILMLTTPLVSMLLGAVGYVLENGAINQVAYGIPWTQSWNSAAKSGLVFEMVRMSWVVVALACLGIMYVSVKNFVVHKNIFFAAVVAFLFIMFLIPYSMGRVDSGAISRPGGVSIFALSLLLPLVAWHLLKSANRALLVLLIACLSATLNFAPLFLSSLISAASAQVSISVLKNGADVGLPSMGKATVEDAHWDRLTRLSRFLNSQLAPDASYLDLTSRNAQYFYLNRRPMMAVTAPYNMASSSQQKDAVRQLSLNVPSIALLEGGNIVWDGGGLALRNPFLYRFVMDNYTPTLMDGMIIGISKVVAGKKNPPSIDVAVKNLTDENWIRGVHRLTPAVVLADTFMMQYIKIGDQVRIANNDIRSINKVWGDGAIWFDGSVIDPSVLGYPGQINIAVNSQIESDYEALLFDKAFAQSDYLKIPVAWGRSKSTLEKHMTLIKSLDGQSIQFRDLVNQGGNYKVSGIDPSVSLDISTLSVSGRNAGLLSFDFTCMGKTAEPRIQVFWWGDDKNGPVESSSVRFTADDGLLIVPLDAAPRWLLTKHIKGIRVDLDNASACTAIGIKNINLLQRH